MTTLVLTLVGDDRAGLVAAVADLVAAHGGNWENSELAELAGAFAGIVEVSIAPERADDLRAALSALDGLLTVNVHSGAESGREERGTRAPHPLDPAVAASRLLTIRVLGNDHPGIVREISSALRAHDLSIDRMTTETRDAAMYGGRLFEATVAVRVPASVDLAEVTDELERLAAEIQVDVVLGA